MVITDKSVDVDSDVIVAPLERRRRTGRCNRVMVNRTAVATAFHIDSFFAVLTKCVVMNLESLDIGKGYRLLRT